MSDRREIAGDVKLLRVIAGLGASIVLALLLWIGSGVESSKIGIAELNIKVHNLETHSSDRYTATQAKEAAIRDTIAHANLRKLVRDNTNTLNAQGNIQSVIVQRLSNLEDKGH